MRPPKPLSAQTVQKHLAALPDWQAVGGNQELVTRSRPPDLLTAILSAATALILAELWSGHARVESRGLDLVVRFATPAAGGVTRNDLRLAALFSEAQPRVAPSGDWRAAIEKSAGMSKDRDDLPERAGDPLTEEDFEVVRLSGAPL